MKDLLKNLEQNLDVKTLGQQIQKSYFIFKTRLYLQKEKHLETYEISKTNINYKNQKSNLKFIKYTHFI